MPEILSLARDDFVTCSITAIKNLWSDTEFADVTLASHDEEQIEAHKVILCAASPFFRRIISKNPHQHPLLFLKNVSTKMLKSVIRFIYLGLGQTEVQKEDLEAFLAIANELAVMGLMTENKER